MTFHEFENEIRDTLAKYVRDKIQIERYTELLMGLNEECAEVTQIIRKSIHGNFHETKIDFPHLEEEIGDVVWYISQVAMQVPDINFEKIAVTNLQKTNKSYKNKGNLSFEEYQQSVIGTYREGLPKTRDEKARYFAIGLLKEMGEVSEVFGELIIDHINLDINKAQEKLGDTLWYLTAICETYGLDLDTSARKNIQKTKGRYDKNGIAQIPTNGEGR